MAFLRTSFVALLLACAANASRSLESARDQYKAHEDVPHPPQLLSRATDQAVDVRQFFKIEPVDNNNQNNDESKPHSKLQSTSGKLQVQSKNSLKNEKVDDLRRRRAIEFIGYNFGSNYYSTWNPAVPAIIPVPPLSSFSLFRPQYYQISRPYFIPVWGSSGKIPFYFPPQPVYTNAGYPVDNPPNKGSLPPKGYLPPDPNSPEPPTSDNITFTGTRFNNEPPPPVWGRVPIGSSTKSPPVPTRRPSSGPTTHPPLVHNAEDAQSVTTTTQRPSSVAQRPQLGTAAGQAPASQSMRPDNDSARQPSRCVWAIVSCCSTSSQEVSYNCFEQLGCGGPFWGSQPCESEFARAAIANVINYYNAK
ncbi:hypothetical protein ILUMI_05500 [Ignelater luminosus]|uniref:Uncharacterized protein n=1 Tax=Ignelater luminosus TaxID=2038154 RepID=A0A8K0DAZ0_IGNLU|nr:hypothetical protein ILUMI_05500 [Ignelater luminosus]